MERINREITILKKVRHPNVVQLYDVSNSNFYLLSNTSDLLFLALLYKMIENNDYLYLIMEYCSGGELF